MDTPGATAQTAGGTMATATRAVKSILLTIGDREIRKPTTKGVTSILNHLRSVDLRIPHQVFDVKVYQEALGVDQGFRVFEVRKNEFHTLVIEAILKTSGVLQLWVADVAKMTTAEADDLPFEDALKVVTESVRLIDVESMMGHLIDFFTEIGGRLVEWNRRREQAAAGAEVPTA